MRGTRGRGGMYADDTEVRGPRGGDRPMGRYNGDLERPQHRGAPRGRGGRRYNDDFAGDFDNYGPRHPPREAQHRGRGGRGGYNDEPAMYQRDQRDHYEDDGRDRRPRGRGAQGPRRYNDFHDEEQ